MKGYSISASLWNSELTFLQHNSWRIHVFNFRTKLNQLQWKPRRGAEAVRAWHQLGRLLSALLAGRPRFHFCVFSADTKTPIHWCSTVHSAYRVSNPYHSVQHDAGGPTPFCFSVLSLSSWIFITGTILFLVQKFFHYISAPSFLLCWRKITSAVALALVSNYHVLPH